MALQIDETCSCDHIPDLGVLQSDWHSAKDPNVAKRGLSRHVTENDQS